MAINRKITALFSEAMAPASFTVATFTLKQGDTAILGVPTCVDRTAVFTPTANLTANTLYTATITTGVTDISGVALVSNKVWTFTTGSTADTTAPTVSSTIPADTATGVVVNANIATTFSEAIDPATITGITYTLAHGVTSVSGTVTSVGNVATFDPASNLIASTLYTATITTGVKDLAGNAVAVNKVWTFTTGSTTDFTAPFVSSTNPANTTVGVAINRNMTATFNEPMNPTTISGTTFTLTKSGTLVPGNVTYVGSVATFDPTSDLTGNTVYTATITTGVTDLAGNAMASNKVWTFTTATVVDTAAPLVSSTNPVDTATGVAINGNITATFNKAMDPATITDLTFLVTRAGTPVLGTVSSVGSVATFDPTGNLLSDTVYLVTITIGVKDLAGNAMAVADTWTFTTDTSIAAGPAQVNLGTAGNFAILSKSGISTVPNSAITGDMGVSPIAQSAITGFTLIADASNTFATSAQDTGKIYAADNAAPTPDYMTTAIGDMEIAYTDAAGRALPDTSELGAGEIGGLTLLPGLYKWGTGVSISTDVTLTGGPNDVWIFQISGGLTQAAAKQVILAGGALPKNIFWQVAGGVDIGTTAQFKGIILSQTSIIVRTNASVNGRLLAQTAVTLQQNAVTQPAP